MSRSISVASRSRRASVYRMAAAGSSSNDPKVHGLQTVPDVGQRATHDHAHRVIEVRGAHLLLELPVLYAAGECVQRAFHLLTPIRHRGNGPPSRGAR